MKNPGRFSLHSNEKTVLKNFLKEKENDDVFHKELCKPVLWYKNLEYLFI